MPDQQSQKDETDDAETAPEQQQTDGSKKPATKRKRTRKAVSTVTKNKDTINARLETVQLPDSLYFKLNSIMGETSSSNKLLLNTLETKTSDLRLTMNDQFWDDEEAVPVKFDANDEYDLNKTYTELPVKIVAKANHTLRQQLSGFTISNTVVDDEDDE